VKLRQSGNGSSNATVADDQTADDDETADDDAQRVVQRTPASPDLATTFKNTAVDEVYTALTQAWDREQLRDLIKRLRPRLADCDDAIAELIGDDDAA
jgi:hypothetical protein